MSDVSYNKIAACIYSLFKFLIAWLFIHTALQAPTVSISTIPIVTAGDQHILNCTATVEEYLIATPTLEWRLPNNAAGMILGQKSMTGSTSTITLTFNQIYTSQGGVYECIATVNISDFDSQSQTTNGTIYVRSKL